MSALRNTPHADRTPHVPSRAQRRIRTRHESIRGCGQCFGEECGSGCVEEIGRVDERGIDPGVHQPGQTLR